MKTLEFFKSTYKNRNLIYNLIQRDIHGRYKGSAMGLLWSLFNPMLMLAVYTFVFSVIFKSRWVGGSESKTEFALVLFAGLMVFNLFSECINRAPTLILNNSNYVKKVVFPLEILPIVSLGSAIFNLTINFIVWIVFYLFFFGTPNITILILPIVLLPLFIMTLGLSWIFASLGVYLRDVTQIIGIATTMLMFLSPIFYPISSLPQEYQSLMQLNPLTSLIEQSRDTMIWGKNLDLIIWLKQILYSTVVAALGLFWFQKTRHGFSDVL